jgi:hypothetical protein
MQMLGNARYSMPSRIAATKPKASMVAQVQLAIYPIGVYSPDMLRLPHIPRGVPALLECRS